MDKSKEKQNWTQHIGKWRKSGKTQREYCRNEGLSYWSFRDQLKKKSSGTSFVAIGENADKSTAGSSIEIIIDGRIRLVLPVNYSREQFRNILFDMGAAPCR